MGNQGAGMGLAVVLTRAQLGIEAPLVQVEVNVGRGIGSFQIVGMPETTVREAKDRVRTALLNVGFHMPVARITVNLSPADLPKQGARYDLAIALGLLVASEQLPEDCLAKVECYGELALNGAIRSVPGLLPSLLACRAAGHQAIIPTLNQSEAELLRAEFCVGVADLEQAFTHCDKSNPLSLICPRQLAVSQNFHGDMQDVRGQSQAKRALLLAAAGGHHILFVGPPGTGKTMLAQRMLGLLPPLNESDALEVAAIQSVSGQLFDSSSWRQRPFRAPHHSCSAAALVGGGSIPRPGEITLAHKGLLFLDELAEIPRHILDTLREPLESGQVCISRAKHTASYPARFQLICALNPSPCGSFDGELQSARATPEQILKYLGRISGPFLDRIDLQVDVPRQPQVLRNGQQPNDGITSQALRRQVKAAHQLQHERQGCLNVSIPVQALSEHCVLDADDHEFLITAIETLKLSHRAYHRLLRLARTIADIDEQTNISRQHLTEAMSYRALDALLNQLRAL